MKSSHIFLFAVNLLFASIVTKAQSPNLVSNTSIASSAMNSNNPLSSEKQIKALQINNLMKNLYESNQFNGSVLVIDKGDLIFHQAFGFANFEKKDTMATNIPVRLASVSKQFTAMAIMLLKEQGKLQYDDPITNYLPELPYSNVTIRNLLQHSSGIPDYLNSLPYQIVAYFAKDKLITNKDLLTYYSLKKPKLNFKPGKNASYCNTGFSFLASIVERVSQMSFPDFMKKFVFEPAKMKTAFVYNARNFETQTTQDTLVVGQDTTLEKFNEIKITTTFKVETRIKNIEKKRAIGYELMFPYPNGYIKLDYHQFDGIYGEKGICASTEDLMQWDKALLENTLVSEQTLREAYIAAPYTDRSDFNYGFGWKIDSKRPKIVFHHGLYRGFRTYLQRNLNEKTLVVILSNVQIGGKMKPILDAVNAILEGKNYKIPKPTKLEKNTLDAFRQSYRIEYGGR